MTTLTLDQASAQLRDLGYTVTKHGARYLVAFDDARPTPLREQELISMASGLAGAAPAEAPLMTVAELDALPAATPAADGTLPLMELLPALEAHAAQLPQPLPPDQRIAVPAGLPGRLNAPLDLVAPGRYQPRTTFDPAELDELAASIAEHGILNPLLVFANERGQLELIAGERRLRAATQAGLRFVPVELRSYTLRQIAEISGIDNIQRAGLTPIEEGRYFNRLMAELTISEAELARRLGKNRAYIQQRRAIAQAAPEVITALDAGDITFSQARAIAQAAPRDPKAQKAAVAKIAELTKRGQRTTETEARAAAEKVVIGKAKALLESLGWQLIERSSGMLLWAPSERPRPWTGAEIAEAVSTKRAPSTDAPPAAPNKHLLATLKMRYRVNDMYAPWIGLSSGEESAELPTFYAAHELTDRLESIGAEWRAMQERAAAAGWTLTVDASHAYGQAHYTFKPAKGQSYSVWGWGDMAKGVAGIESGKIKPTPAATQVYQPTTYTCEQCGKKGKDYNYVERRHLCNACAKAAKAQIEARQQQVAAETRQILQPWLERAPLDALRLLLALYHQQPYRDDLVAAWSAQIRAATPAALIADILAKVASRADDYRAAPLYDVRASVSAAVPPGSSSEAPAAASPLDELRTALAAVRTWLDQDVDSTPAEEIHVNLAELAAIRARLVALSDAPEVGDAELEALLALTGELEREIGELDVAEESAVGA